MIGRENNNEYERLSIAVDLSLLAGSLVVVWIILTIASEWLLYSFFNLIWLDIDKASIMAKIALWVASAGISLSIIREVMRRLQKY